MEDYRKIAIELGQTLISKAPETKEDVERMLPELKESEDERIRKEIIKIFNIERFEGYNIDNREVIAWLEKQGNQKPADKVEPKFKAGDWVCHTVYKKPLLIVEDLGEGDFRTEPKSIITAKEFREGVFKLWTIQDAKDGDVVVDKSDGTVGIFQSIGHHPDGGSCNDSSYCFLHCRYDDGFFYADFDDGNTIDSDDLIPATKEQHDLLFQKIKEKGYEWDAEKKELKKIEQNPAWTEEDKNMLEWIIGYLENKMLNTPISEERIACKNAIAWFKKLEGEQKLTDTVEPKFKVGDWVVCEAAPRYTAFKIGDVIQISSKETLKIFLMVKDCFRPWTIQDAKDGDVLYLQKDGKEHIIIYKGVLKERFKTFVSAYCAYNGIVDAFCFADVSRYVDIAYGGIMPATKEQRDFLFQKMREAGYEWDAEKLELRKIEQKPAWSEEDKDFMYNTLSNLTELKDRYGEGYGNVGKCINWLKSLRPQNTWKPSDGQLKALKEAACYSSVFSEKTINNLISLSKQLKKLMEE